MANKDRRGRTLLLAPKNPFNLRYNSLYCLSNSMGGAHQRRRADHCRPTPMEKWSLRSTDKDWVYLGHPVIIYIPHSMPHVWIYIPHHVPPASLATTHVRCGVWTLFCSTIIYNMLREPPPWENKAMIKSSI